MGQKRKNVTKIKYTFQARSKLFKTRLRTSTCAIIRNARKKCESNFTWRKPIIKFCKHVISECYYALFAFSKNFRCIHNVIHMGLPIIRFDVRGCSEIRKKLHWQVFADSCSAWSTTDSVITAEQRS